jgi:hypothetical protein
MTDKIPSAAAPEDMPTATADTNAQVQQDLYRSNNRIFGQLEIERFYQHLKDLYIKDRNIFGSTRIKKISNG